MSVIPRSLHGYRRFWLTVDVVAGATLAAARAQSAPGLAVFRCDAELYYANASRLTDVEAVIQAAPDAQLLPTLDTYGVLDQFNLANVFDILNEAFAAYRVDAAAPTP